MGDVRNAYTILTGKLERRYLSGDLGVDGSVLKCTLNK
jgi:hypothetical protein